MVPLGRFERPTRGLGNRCSILLSYRGTQSDVIITENHNCGQIPIVYYIFKFTFTVVVAIIQGKKSILIRNKKFSLKEEQHR